MKKGFGIFRRPFVIELSLCSEYWDKDNSGKSTNRHYQGEYPRIARIPGFNACDSSRDTCPDQKSYGQLNKMTPFNILLLF